MLSGAIGLQIIARRLGVELGEQMEEEGVGHVVVGVAVQVIQERGGKLRLEVVPGVSLVRAVVVWDRRGRGVRGGKA